MSRLKKKQAVAEDSSDIDLTPMLDVVFIMLIFFIVTASFVKEKTVGVNTPPDNQQPVQTAAVNNMLIEVNANNEVRVDDRRVDIRSVKSLIAQKKAENQDAAVVIRAHELSNAETYIKLADASRELDITNVSLVPYK